MMPTTSCVPVCGTVDGENMAWLVAIRIPLSMPSRLKADLLGLGNPSNKIRLLAPFSEKGQIGTSWT